MHEERSAVQTMVECNRISVVDGQRLLSILTEDNMPNETAYRNMRLTCLLWLDTQRYNAAIALEMLSIINQIEQKHQASMTSEEMDFVIKSCDVRLIEPRVAILIFAVLDNLYDLDPLALNHETRREILRKLSCGSITGTTALEQLQLTIPLQQRVSISHERVASTPTKFKEPSIEERFAGFIRSSSNIIQPQKNQAWERVQRNMKPIKDAKGSQSLQEFIQEQVGRAIEEGRQKNVMSNVSSTTVDESVIPRSSQKTVKSSANAFDQLLDDLHDSARELNVAVKLVVENWEAFIKAPHAASFEVLLHKAQSSLSIGYQKLAKVSEAKHNLEMHLKLGNDSDIDIAQELLAHVASTYKKQEEQLKNIADRLAELAALNRMQEDDNLTPI